jgi:multidrug resistance efflux pump
MSDTSRIPVPWTQRWRTIRFQVLPYVFFFVCVMLTVYLWNRHAGSPNAVGEVFAPRIDLTSTGEGVLLDLGPEIELFKHVRQGDVIARIDDKPVLAEIATLKSQLKMFQADAVGTEEEMRLEHEDRVSRERENKRRLKEMVNKARIEYAKARTTKREAEAKLTGIEKQLDAIKNSNQKIVAIPLLTVWPLETEQKSLKELIAQSKAVMDEAEAQYTDTKKILDEFPPEPEADLTKLTSKALAEAEAQQKLIQAAELRQQMLDIKAPIDGVICTIYRRPGQQVKIGEPILTIASTDGQFILSYLQQGRNITPEPNMQVEIHRRQVPRQTFSGRVVSVGAQVEMVATQLTRMRDTNLLEWGLPVQIELPPTADLRPGELVDLRFKSTGGGATQTMPVRRPDGRFSAMQGPST